MSASDDRFAVIGVSDGGPYALACGQALKDRMTRIDVAVGIAPREEPGIDKAAIGTTGKGDRDMHERLEDHYQG